MYIIERYRQIKPNVPLYLRRINNDNGHNNNSSSSNNDRYCRNYNIRSIDDWFTDGRDYSINSS